MDREEIARCLAEISREIGSPVTEEEILADSSGAPLSDADLEAVSGGAWRPSAANLVTSIASLGVACAIQAVFSALQADIDRCASDRMRNFEP